jgi:hypothetical protein
MAQPRKERKRNLFNVFSGDRLFAVPRADAIAQGMSLLLNKTN